MNYKIKTLDRKTTSSGKPMIKATIADESGVETTGVAIWSSFQDFANLTEGSQVAGELVTTQNGNYTNRTLESPATGIVGRSGGGFKGNMSAMVEKKQEGIKLSMEHKDLSIKISSVNNKAVDCAVAEYHKDAHNLDTLEELIEKWKKYLWLSWDNYDSFPPFA